MFDQLVNLRERYLKAKAASEALYGSYLDEDFTEEDEDKFRSTNAEQTVSQALYRQACVNYVEKVLFNAQD